MFEPVTTRPGICLNMIVRNEAHIVAEVLDAVAPYISSWVIVDTGSNDGTQDLIRNQMARLGIPGELYERPWRNFGDNRTEALTLAQGHGDYIWVIDADDILVGTPDFTRLSADIYWLRRANADDIYWLPFLFRDGARVRWVGVTHEYAAWDDSYVAVQLEGEYRIEDSHLSARNLSGQKYARDRDLLLAEVERNPEDARCVFYLAQSYFDLGDFANARKWYARRVEMGGFDEEVHFAMLRIADSMTHLGAPLPRRSRRLPAGVGVQADPRGATVFHCRPVPRRAALPARPPVCQARRRNPAPRTRHNVGPRRHPRLARNR